MPHVPDQEPDVLVQYLSAVRAAIDAIESDAVACDSRGGAAVRNDDSQGPAGPCLRHRPFTDGRRGDVSALWLVSGLSPDRRAVDDLSQRGRGGQRPAPGDVPGKRPGIWAGALAQLRDLARRRTPGHLDERLQRRDDRRGSGSEAAGDVRRCPDSLEHAAVSTSRHESGKKLHEIADLVLDQQAPAGDSAVWVDGLETPVAPLSSVTGCAIVNLRQGRGRPPAHRGWLAAQGVDRGLPSRSRAIARALRGNVRRLSAPRRRAVR